MENITPPLGLKNIPTYAAFRAMKHQKEFPYSGLWLFSGSQGFGKTLLATTIVQGILDQYPDCIVVSNIALYGIPSFPYKGIEDFDSYNNGSDGIIFFLDEIQTLFSSMESRGMPLSTIQIWSQNRKNRRVIIGTSQRFSRVAKPIREQCQWIYNMQRPIWIAHRYQLLDATLIDDEGKYNGKAVRPHWFIPGYRALTAYNTLEVIRRKEKTDDSSV